MNRIVQPIAYTLAAIYLLVDLIFTGLAKPIADWVARHLAFRRLRAWIRSLPPYPSLALFSVPLVLLEPVKPVAAYLAATGQVLGGALVFVTGDLLKLVLVERLFSLTRNNLMKISAFVWAYGHYKIAMGWLKNTEAWKTMRAVSYSALRSIKKLAWRGRPTPRYRAAREMTD